MRICLTPASVAHNLAPHHRSMPWTPPLITTHPRPPNGPMAWEPPKRERVVPEPLPPCPEGVRRVPSVPLGMGGIALLVYTTAGPVSGVERQWGIDVSLSVVHHHRLLFHDEAVPSSQGGGWVGRLGGGGATDPRAPGAPKHILRGRDEGHPLQWTFGAVCRTCVCGMC